MSGGGLGDGELRSFETECVVGDSLGVSKEVLNEQREVVFWHGCIKDLFPFDKCGSVENAIDAGSEGGFELEEIPDDGLDIGVEVAIDLDAFGSKDVFHFGEGVAFEGRSSVDHFIEQDAECPDVGGGSVGDAEDDLGGHVLEGAADGALEVGGGGESGGPAEVAEFDVELVVEQHVFGLDVPVEHPPLVQVPQRPRGAAEEAQRQPAGQPLLRVDEVEEAPVRRVLEQDVDRVADLQAVDELDDVRVAELRVQTDLQPQVLPVLLLQLGDVDLITSRFSARRAPRRGGGGT